MGVTFYIGFNTVQLVLAQIRLGMGLYCISKVLKKVVFAQIADFIQHHFVSLCQFGFLKNRSTLQKKKPIKWRQMRL